jgi:ATP-dependent helicase/DNAse subunit B
MLESKPLMTADEPKTRNLFTGDYPDLEIRFETVVRRVKREDPLRPLIAIIPSHLLGLHLARTLADKDVPHANIHFKTLKDLAGQIASPQLLQDAKMQPPSLACEALIGEVIAELNTKESDFYFRGIAKKPGSHEAILSSIHDLKLACLDPDTFDELCDRPGIDRKCNHRKSRDILKIWRAYEDRMRALGWYDDAHVDEVACGKAGTSDLVTDSSGILLYGFYDLNELQRRLVMSLAAANNVTAFVPFTKEHAFEYAMPIVSWLESEGFTVAPPGCGPSDGAAGMPRSEMRTPALERLCENLFSPGGSLDSIEDSLLIMSVPGEAREAREIIRLVSEEVRDERVAPHEIAILTRHSHPYTGLFRDMMEGLEVTPYILEGRKMGDTRTGKCLGLFLEILRDSFSRRAVMEYATFSGKGNAAALWDLISMDAGIVEGQDEWESHLEELLKELKAGRRSGPYKAEDVNELLSFVRRLAKSLGAIQRSVSWADIAKHLTTALTEIIGKGDYSKDITEALRDLRLLDQVGVVPTAAGLIGFIDDILETTVDSTGRFQRNGPSVMSLIAARGIPFKVVILPGLVEKSFPAPARQDAILLDGERRALNREISGSEDHPIQLRGAPQLDKERLFFRLAVGAAKEKLVLTYPRLAIGTARERVPSSFVLATMEAALGHRVDFYAAENFRGFLRIPLARIGSDAPSSALDEAEFDISLASQDLTGRKKDAFRYLQATSRSFSRALDLETSRWGKRAFTAYDGILACEKALKHLKAKYSIVGRSVGPTRLETYAACPYKYYLRMILGLETLVEPEREPSIDPLDRGSLIHSVLWKFFTALKKKRKRTPFALKPEDVGLLQEILARSFEEFERQGITGYPLMWEMEQAEIRRRLEGLLEEELLRQESEPDGYLPAYFEVRYGMEPYGQEESEISVEEPVPLPFGERRISVRGKIDRIDLAGGFKHARVVDYKTGKATPKFKENDLMQGTSLQLVLYLKAARVILGRIHKGIEVDYAEYYSLGQSGRKRHIRFDSGRLGACQDQLTAILNTIADGIEAGLFFAYPGEACRTCDYDRICGGTTEREFVYDLKSDDKKISAFRAVKGDVSDV